MRVRVTGSVHCTAGMRCVQCSVRYRKALSTWHVEQQVYTGVYRGTAGDDNMIVNHDADFSSEFAREMQRAMQRKRKRAAVARMLQILSAAA